MPIIRFGLDLAKNSIAIYGVNEHEKMVLRKTLKREKLQEFFANAPPALVAMEAGSGAHHWARELRALGHDARIIDPRFVAPYRQQGHTGKNDFNDAAAVCEAAGRPHMRFIPVKSKEQQAILLVHRLRQACVTEHTPCEPAHVVDMLRYTDIVCRWAGAARRLRPFLGMVNAPPHTQRDP